MTEDSKGVFIKELYIDDNTGKILIHDSNNNDYECNLYGNKMTKFLPNLTGFIGSKERKNMNHFDKPIINDKSKDNYHPQKSNFRKFFIFL